ncbi:MAG: CpaF family protein, partial [Chloroflexi bacterium]|nr:CpaF family protein [Chloroflexota bacterium]
MQRRLLSELSPWIDTSDVEKLRPTLEQIFNEAIAEEQMPLTRLERSELLEEITADLLGLGPLEPLLKDDSITEILVNGPYQIYVERKGILQETNVRLADNAELMRIIERIVAPLGRRVDESSPMVDARLPDGSRVNITIPPLALNGPCLSIRKFAKAILGAEDLIRLGTISRDMADFMRACVLSRLNIVVSGGTSTGKTTLLNVLSSFLPPT